MTEARFASAVSCKISELETAEWMEGWKESFKPFATKKFLVHPPWEKPTSDDGLKPLVIEPGMAFGTGQHATTQLCLKIIEDQFAELNPKNCLDVGTGTGILAIALSMLGCNEILATDIDADAIIATRENADMNDVAFEVVQDSVPAGVKADFVIANILFVVIRRIFSDFNSSCEPGGKLLLSGILEEELGELKDLAAQHAWEIEALEVETGWSAILLRKS